MSTPAATLDILIDVRAKLDALLESQERFRQAREEAQGFGTMLKTGLGIDLARRGLDLLNNSLRATVAAAMQTASALQDTSNNLRISTTALQVYVNAARDAGASSQVMIQALTQLSRTTIEARDGTGRLAAEFAHLGLNAATLAELPLEHQLAAVAQSITSAADQGAAFNSAMQILGTKNAPQLITMLRRLGRDGFGAMARDVQRTWGIMSEDTIRRMADTKAQIDRVKNQAQVAVAEGLGDLNLDEAAGIAIKGAVGITRGFFEFWKGLGRTAAAMTYGLDAVAESDAEARRREQERKDFEDFKRLEADRSSNALGQLDYLRSINAANIERIRNDPTLNEVERRKQLVEALQQEKGYLEKIHALKIEGTKIFKDEEGNVIYTEATLEANRELYKILAQTYGLAASIHELGESPFARSRRAAREVNDPTANPNATSLTDGLGIGALDWASALGSRSEQVAVLMNDTLGNAVRGISDGIYGWVTGTGDFGDALLDIGDTILRRLLDTIIEMGVQWVITGGLAKATMTAISALSSMLRRKETAETLAAEAAKSGPLMGNAVAANAGSFGMSAIIGLAVLAALMAAFGGFADGGYTGAGGKNDVAGVVHRGEVVFSQADISRLGGLGVVEGLRTAGVSAPSVPSPVLSNGAAATAASGRPQRVVVVDNRNPDLLDQMMNDPRFENHLQTVISRNPGAFGIGT